MSTFQNNSPNNQPFMSPMKPTTGLQVPRIGDMNWGMSTQNTQQIGPANFLTPAAANSSTAINTGVDFNTIFNNKPGGGFEQNGYPMSSYDKQLPGKEGGWIQPAQIGLGVARIGLDTYNAINQSKMNKFMQSYYGDQMELMKTDFANAARGANEALSSKQGRVLAASGVAAGTDAHRQGVADYMAQWGAKETV